MFKSRIAEEILPLVIGAAFLVNLIVIIIVQVGANIQEVQTIALIVVSMISFFATWWLSHNSPQAVAATIQKREHINCKRQLYYDKLNDNIIKRLSQLRAIPVIESSERFSPNNLHVIYNLRWIKENPLYSRAMDQLNSDFPGFSDAMNRIENEVNIHNESVDHFISKTKKMIIEKFSEIGHLETDHSKMMNGSIREDFIMDLIFQKANQVSDKLSKFNDYSQNELHINITKMPHLHVETTDDNRLWVDGLLTAMGIQENGNQKIVESIERYQHDTSIIEEFIRFKRRQVTFEIKAKELAEKCKRISSLIDMEEYYTITDHCKDNRFI